MIKKLPTKLLKNDIDLWQVYLMQSEGPSPTVIMSKFQAHRPTSEKD